MEYKQLLSVETQILTWYQVAPSTILWPPPQALLLPTPTLPLLQFLLNFLLLSNKYIPKEISFKLTAENFLLWKAQVFSVLRTHNLLGFVDGSLPTPSEDPDDIAKWYSLIRWSSTGCLVLSPYKYSLKWLTNRLQERCGVSFRPFMENSPSLDSAIEDRSLKYSERYNNHPWLYP